MHAPKLYRNDLKVLIESYAIRADVYEHFRNVHKLTWEETRRVLTRNGIEFPKYLRTDPETWTQ